jgi:spore maturation protein CgeB
VLYGQWEGVRGRAEDEVRGADAVIVTSFCHDAPSVLDLLLAVGSSVKVFYDLDTPVTLSSVRNGKLPPYIGPRRLSDFDMVISYTGGESLEGLKGLLGARRVATLYGWVDPESHRPVPVNPDYAGILSYLGTYAPDRQDKLQELFISVAERLPAERFILGGAQYPSSFPWRDNVMFTYHVPPPEHPAFFCSSLFTLNITRSDMAQYGFCPSARLFEAASCGVPILSDRWSGLELFLSPGSEVVTVSTTREVMEALLMSEEERLRIVGRARERTLSEHTAFHRALELEMILEIARRPMEASLCGE